MHVFLTLSFRLIIFTPLVILGVAGSVVWRHITRILVGLLHVRIHVCADVVRMGPCCILGRGRIAVAVVGGRISVAVVMKIIVVVESNVGGRIAVVVGMKMIVVVEWKVVGSDVVCWREDSSCCLNEDYYCC